jgi:hypothetical protein
MPELELPELPIPDPELEFAPVLPLCSPVSDPPALPLLLPESPLELLEPPLPIPDPVPPD